MADVVIVGAGPVGLWIAAEMARQQLDVVVLEKLAEPSPHSKAMTIHPGTLQLFEQRGLVDQFLETGIPIPTGHFGTLEKRLDFQVLDTTHPYTLLFPQAATEAILEKTARALGADIRRGHEVVDTVQADGRVRTTVDGPGGTYTLESAYVVGADGAGSIVRKRAAIDFPGTDTTAWGFLGDVFLDNPPVDHGFSLSAASGQIMIVPLPDGRHRFVGIDPAAQHIPTGELTYDEFRTTVADITGSDYGMHDPIWLSRFGNASRQATDYRQGRVLLAGDAAHMHFPAGGVGMNVGLQDAANLAWRLADVLNGHAPVTLLDGYQAERRPVGSELIRGTQAQTALMMSFNPDGLALRSLLNEMIDTVPALSEALAGKLSAISTRYPQDPGTHPEVGTRAPNVELATGPADDLFGSMHAGNYVFVLVGDTTPPASPHGYAVVTTSPAAMPERLAGATAMLVRPDGYIGWVQTAEDPAYADLDAVLRVVRGAE